MTRVLALLAALLAVFLPAAQAFAAGPDSIHTAEKVIVVFRDELSSQSLQPWKDGIVRAAGASEIKRLPLVNAVAATLSPAAQRDLARLPGVLRIDPDYTMRVPEDAPGPEMGAAAQATPWGVVRVKAPLAWPTNRGLGVKVAVLDTGIDLDHPDLLDNIKGGINIINPLLTPDDDFFHGTHVAGIVAAADNGIGVVGVAPLAELYAVKVLDAQGNGQLSDIILGLQWAIDNGMQVVNMSFGGPEDAPTLRTAITAASDAGIVLVASAGNEGLDNQPVAFPAAYPEVIAVAATARTDALAVFSSRGPEVELAAPGVDVPSTIPGGRYFPLSGTSMSAPHVSGAAALVIASGMEDIDGNGRINNEVRARLDNTARDLGLPRLAGRDENFGFGLVDAQVAASTEPRPPAVSTGRATAVARTSARLNGELTRMGSALSVAASFVWGTAPGSLVNETPAQTMATAGPFFADLSGLTPGQTYFFRAKAVGDGQALGALSQFRFLPLPPRVATLPATEVTRVSARLNGRLMAVGSTPPITVSFLWGTAPRDLGNETTPAELSEAGLFSAEVTGLTAGVTYFFRARAVGLDGVSLGAIMRFRFVTLPPRVLTLPATPVAAETATLNGRLLGLGSAASVDVSFVWGTSPLALDNEAFPTVFTLSAPADFSAQLAGLTPGTTYFARARAAGDGVRLGGLIRFRTAAQ